MKYPNVIQTLIYDGKKEQKKTNKQKKQVLSDFRFLMGMSL